ncbi:hypothetical protein CANCADRAFT_4482 [Tortispora caseinolytica NRRL Y-17796]|uniref:Uncharacterized protein n=1 Tax=Tortispora caseinolytica NRRL Y-17796 TaxID=767744 RepID=A0A1E4T9D7_9ASCO|nr:hypothetical protein CANCADRAFT_4482 [Tortispora caseinolytica NRRL Y-17796]
MMERIRGSGYTRVNQTDSKSASHADIESRKSHILRRRRKRTLSEFLYDSCTDPLKSAEDNLWKTFDKTKTHIRVLSEDLLGKDCSDSLRITAKQTKAAVTGIVAATTAKRYSARDDSWSSGLTEDSYFV